MHIPIALGGYADACGACTAAICSSTMCVTSAQVSTHSIQDQGHERVVMLHRRDDQVHLFVISHVNQLQEDLRQAIAAHAARSAMVTSKVALRSHFRTCSGPPRKARCSASRCTRAACCADLRWLVTVIVVVVELRAPLRIARASRRARTIASGCVKATFERASCVLDAGTRGGRAAGGTGGSAAGSWSQHCATPWQLQECPRRAKR